MDVSGSTRRNVSEQKNIRLTNKLTFILLYCQNSMFSEIQRIVNYNANTM